jgi:catechol 2,3-dioxygenase-like lactoylglutathione lyase family enzyme
MLRDAPVIAILPAADIERAKRFYLETLDLRRADVPAPGNDIIFECGEGTLLYVYEREAGTKADHTVAGWLVEDVEEVVEELGERGVVFEQYDMPGLKTDERGIAEMDGEKTAWFKDPEGNILAITEMVR